MDYETIAREKARLAERREKRQSKIDAISTEEIDALACAVESFESASGLEPAERFEQLKKVCRLMLVRADQVSDYGVTLPDGTIRNASVEITLGLVNCLADEAVTLWKMATNLADHIYIVSTAHSIVVSFIVIGAAG